MPSFYAPKLTKTDRFFVFTDEEFHHISHVFRKKEGDAISLTNGKGIMADALIKNIRKKDAIVEITKIKEFFHTKPNISVAFSLLKEKNDHLTIEKLTELGVREFFPIITDRTIKKVSSSAKYVKTAISAIKQCDNAFLPTINEPIKFAKLFDILDMKKYKPFVAFENEHSNTFFDLYDNEKNICLIFGPEGGFSSSEIDIMQDKDLAMFTIGNHILRAETAAISASAIVLNSIFEKNRQYY